MRSAVGIPFLSALKSGSRQAEGGEDVNRFPANTHFRHDQPLDMRRLS